MTRDERAALEEIERLLFGQAAPHTADAIASFTGLHIRTVQRIEERALDKLRVMVDPEWEGPNTDDDRVGYVEGTGAIVRRTGNSRSRPTTKLRK